MNPGISVSRVGGSAQIKAMRQVAGSLRLDLAQYRELQAFAQFGSDLDPATQAQLSRGSRLVEILKQNQYEPLSVERQVVIIFAATKGHLDDLDESTLARFEADFFTFLETRHANVFAEIVEKKTISDELEGSLAAAIEEFKKTFAN